MVGIDFVASPPHLVLLSRDPSTTCVVLNRGSTYPWSEPMSCTHLPSCSRGPLSWECYPGYREEGWNTALPFRMMWSSSSGLHGNTYMHTKPSWKTSMRSHVFRPNFTKRSAHLIKCYAEHEELARTRMELHCMILPVQCIYLVLPLRMRGFFYGGTYITNSR
jgi:hypothetical protein